MKNVFLVVVLFLASLSAAFAEPMAENDIPVRYLTSRVTYDVHADGSFTETTEYSTVILKENAVERFKEGAVTFSTSVAKGEILDAYTIKKSGKRIDAPKSSYQVTTNDGYADGKPLYSDETTITVIFSDVAVGDTIVFSHKVTNSEGIFPGHFSVAHQFSRFVAYDDVSIKIVAPSSMKLRRESYFLTEKKPVEKDGKQYLEWTYHNKSPEKWTPADAGVSAVGDEPSLYVSTFDSYKQIAEMYAARALPKVVVDERVKALAAQIAKGKTSPEDRARTIYDWVAQNITYGGNCIGIGAVVPRDISVILDNKMGDCKDHATLLQALLAAQGIEGEQALVNAGSGYDLPKTPVVSSVNHVINYIPSMKLFADSTASDVPFGMVPFALGEKPVLLVSHFRDGVKIPSTSAYGHEQVMKTTVHVNPDGSATGSSQVSMKGLPAAQMRSALRKMGDGQEDLAARKMLESQGFHGTGKMLKDDPKELLDTYKFGIEFKIDDLVAVSSTTGMTIRPIFASALPIASFVLQAYDPMEKKPVACTGGKSTEEFVFEFPEELKVVAIPKDFEISTPSIQYRATYRKSGNTLTVKRELHDKTTTNVCTVAFMEEYKKASRKLVADLKSQVLLTN